MKLKGLILGITLIFSIPARGQQPLPEDADDVYQFWNLREKYYIIVAADEYSDNSANLPFVTINSMELAHALEMLGYKSLSLPGQTILSGKDVTEKNIKELLDIPIEQGLTAQTTLLIYYAGHGVKDPQGRDIWLQVSDEPLGPYKGVSVGSIIHTLRGQGYLGDLAILVDACFSGDSAISSTITLSDFGRYGKTALITSASGEQSSYQVEIPGVQASAFSYVLLDGLGGRWGDMDSDKDGIVNSYELRIFSESSLRDLKINKYIRDEMTPYSVSIPAEMIMAYRRDKVENWNTPARKNIVKFKIDTNTGGQISALLFKKLRASVKSVAVTASEQTIGVVNIEDNDGPWSIYAEADAVRGSKISFQFLGAKNEILAKNDLVFASTEPSRIGVPRARGVDLFVDDPSRIVLSYEKTFYKVGASVELVGTADALLGSKYDNSMAANAVEAVIEKYDG